MTHTLCTRCNERIDTSRQYGRRDRTGAAVCPDCLDCYIDVTLVEPPQGIVITSESYGDLRSHVVDESHWDSQLNAPAYECADCGEAMTANVSRCDECIAAEDEVDRQREIERLNGPDYDFHDDFRDGL